MADHAAQSFAWQRSAIRQSLHVDPNTARVAQPEAHLRFLYKPLTRHLAAHAFNKKWMADCDNCVVQTMPGKAFMWDLLALLFTVAFFAIALWYVQGCEKLR
jgi:hypothetical protein